MAWRNNWRHRWRSGLTVAAVVFGLSITLWGFCITEGSHEQIGKRHDTQAAVEWVRAVRAGVVTGTARPLHLGSRTQVWQVEIRDGEGRLACVSRVTMAVGERSCFASEGDSDRG